MPPTTGCKKRKALSAWFKRTPDGRLLFSIGATEGATYPLVRGWKWVEFREVLKRKKAKR